MTDKQLDALEQYLHDWFDSAFRNEDVSTTRHYRMFMQVLELIGLYRDAREKAWKYDQLNK